MKKVKVFFLGVCLCLLSNLAIGQISPHKKLTQYQIKNWQTEHGLPQNSVTVVTQSSNGFLWIGTYDGLSRFDGVKFTTINRKNNTELTSSYILSLAEDASGSLWIGTSNAGLWYYNQDSLSQASFNQTLAKDDITALLLDTRGNLWIGTYGKGLYRWDGVRLKHWSVEDGIPGNIIQTLHESYDGNIWAGTRGSGVFYLKSDTEIEKIWEKEGITNGYIRDIDQDDSGNIWIATSGGGIFKQNGSKWINFTEKDGLNSNIINSILIDELGTIWLGTETGGLNRFSEGKFESYTSSLSLGSDTITNLFIDRENNLWMGTSGGGLTRLSDGKFTSVTETEGLISNFIWTVAEDLKGRIWLGTNGDGISIIDDLSVSHLTSKDGLKNGFVRTILSGKDGSMWVGTYKGLHRFKDGKLIKVYDEQNGLGSSLVLSLYEDKDEAIWVGLSGAGIVKIKNGLIEKRYDSFSGLSNTYVRSIIKDYIGNIWVGTGGGGITIIDKDDHIKIFSTDQGLKSNTIIALYEDNRNRMWIGTHGGGLSMIENDVVHTITVIEGLSDDIIFHILEDKTGNLWMSSNRGIIKVPKRDILDYFYGKTKKIHPKLYGKADGMKSSESNGANQPAALHDSKGNMWFPTVKGVSYIDADELNPNPIPSQVIIESVILDNEKEFNTLPKQFDKKYLSYQFNYTSPTFSAIEKLSFKVQLIGFDQDWIEKGNQRSTIYTNLPHGDYTFHVKARNDDDIETEFETTYSFTIPTPFYFTYWAYSFYFLFIVGLAYSSYVIQKRKALKKQEEELAFAQLKFDAERERLKRETLESKARELEREYELEIQKKVADLERKERESEKVTAQSFAEGVEKERARVARELHDQILGSLSSIMRKVQIEAKKTTDYQSLMEKMDTLLKELDEIGHDIRNIMDDLKPGTLDFFNIADTIESLIQKQADKAIHYIKVSASSPSILPNLSTFQNVTIYRIFQEGIHNAIKHGNPNEIRLSIDLKDNNLVLSLKNNGTTFNVEQTLEKVNTRKEKSGNGLLNMQHRAQTIDGTIEWISENKWTELRLSIPLSSTK